MRTYITAFLSPLVFLSPLLAQTISPDVTGALNQTGKASVIIVLRDQPQPAIYQAAEARELPRLTRLRTEASALPDDRPRRQALDAAEIDLRREVFTAIRARISAGQDALEASVTRAGGVVTGRVAAINAIFAEIDRAALAELERNPSVLSVELNRELSIKSLAASNISMGSPALWRDGFEGTGESVAVFDTGIASQHPMFAGLDLVPMVFLGNASRSTCFGDDASTPEDRQGHGSHVAGIVAGRGIPSAPDQRGVARGLGKLYSIKVGFRTRAIQGQCREGRGSFLTTDIFAGVDWVLQNTPARIFNMSFGADASADDGFEARYWDFIADSFRVLPVVSAGNEGPARLTIGSPAIAYNALTVGSVNNFGLPSRERLAMSIFSSRGPTRGGRKKPDVLAPGDEILSAAFDSAGLVAFSGTSMAAPHVAGAAALVSQLGIRNPTSMKALLINSSDGVQDWNPDAGWGYVNLNRIRTQQILEGAVGANETLIYRVDATGDVKATLAWNRHAGEDWRMTPAMNDLDLYLVRRSDNASLDASDSRIDNVEQVSGSLAGPSVLVVRNFANRVGTRETFSLAVLGGRLTATRGPVLDSTCSAPVSVLPSASFNVTCTVANTGDVEAHRVTGRFALSSGFTGGTDFTIGTIAPGARVSATWSLRAGVTIGAAALRFTVDGALADLRFSAAAINVNVSVAGTAAPVLVVSPTAIEVSAAQGSAAVTREVRLSAGTAAVNFNVTTSAAWAVMPATGSTAQPLTLRLTPGSLAPGTYNATVTFTPATAGVATQQMPVRFIITPARATVTIAEQRTTRTTRTATGCPRPDPVTTFLLTDDKVGLWFIARGTQKGDLATVQWIAPDGAVRTTSTFSPIAESGDYCMAGSMDLSDLPSSAAGAWRARILWAGVEVAIVNFTVNPGVRLTDVRTSLAAPGASCTAPRAADKFRSSDSRIYAYFLNSNARTGDIPSIRWIKPDGTEFRVNKWNPVPSNGGRCYWDWLDTERITGENIFGVWTVEILWNDRPMSTLKFDYAPPIVVPTALFSRDDPRDMTCRPPAPAGAFRPSDSTLTFWFETQAAKKGDRPVLEWIAPDGSVYSRDAWDELESDGDWCLWAWMNVRGTSVADNFGTWRVRLSWNRVPVLTRSIPLQAVEVEGRRMTTTILEDICEVPPAVSEIRTTDARARLWFILADVAAGAQVTTEWIDPDGTTVRRGAFTPFESSGRWCMASTLTVEGMNRPAGRWKVIVRYDGTELFTHEFRIVAAATGGTMQSLSAVEQQPEPVDVQESERRRDVKPPSDH